MCAVPLFPITHFRSLTRNYIHRLQESEKATILIKCFTKLHNNNELQITTIFIFTGDLFSLIRISGEWYIGHPQIKSQWHLLSPWIYLYFVNNIHRVYACYFYEAINLKESESQYIAKFYYNASINVRENEVEGRT